MKNIIKGLLLIGAATFAWEEFTQNATDTSAPTNLNFGSTNSVDLAPSTYPITAGTYSYEKWIKAAFSGSFTRIENVLLWKSSGDYVTGEGVTYTGQTAAFATPTNSVSTEADTAIPTSEPGTANVGIGAGLSGSLEAAGSTAFMVLQSTIDTTASAGLTNTKTLTLQYDEV